MAQPEPLNFNNQKTTCNVDNFYILLAFLFVTILLLIITDDRLFM